jgi:hypothetical protein
MNNSLINRPPIGFIVEGKGEYHCYPSIITRVLGENRFKIPIINANGIGGIINHLKEHLSDMVTSHKPFSIIVTIDLRDVIENKQVSNCRELKTHIEKDIDEWRQNSKDNKKFEPFPEKFSVVIQIKKFESWIIADKEGLKSSGYMIKHDDHVQWDNVDNDVEKPCAWLEEMCGRKLKFKNPDVCKSLFNCLDLNNVKLKSVSFNKFCREVNQFYSAWKVKCLEFGGHNT